MGLSIGLTCINCKKYVFDLEEAVNSRVEKTSKTGAFAIPVTCGVCHAKMAFVYIENIGKWAVAYNHTINDEPCYDEECDACRGKEEYSWWAGNDE